MYETCACVIHTNLHTLSAACAHIVSCMYCHLTLMFAWGTCALVMLCIIAIAKILPVVKVTAPVGPFLTRPLLKHAT